MKKCTVKELAKLSGVSVRALHHYDRIGLLGPAERSAAGYRLYGQDELLRLQQILLYKELDFSLGDIKEILDNPGFDMLEALTAHKQELLKRKNRVNELLKTVDHTIQQLHHKNEKMDYNEMYKGFSKDQAEAYETEAKNRWGNDIVEESKQHILAMGKNDWAEVKNEMEAINREMALLMDLPAGHDKIQALVKRHFNLIGKFYTVTREIYSGLAEMYVADERFKENYEKHRAGLAEFLKEAMLIYCHGL